MADSGETVAGLPTWPEIKGHALSHLHAARTELAEVRDWLGVVDSPLTPAEKQAASETRKLVSQAKNLIDEAKGLLHG